jgi:hypothetical protein
MLDEERGTAMSVGRGDASEGGCRRFVVAASSRRREHIACGALLVVNTYVKNRKLATEVGMGPTSRLLWAYKSLQFTTQ